ncbi:MAG: prolipoprotein diacylglyceryl transferase family protein [Rubrobacteraceae bacterium]
MNGIIIGTDPMIAHAEPFMLSWYNFFFMLAIGLGAWLGLHEARRMGLDLEKVQTVILLSVLGGVVGARLYHAGETARTNLLIMVNFNYAKQE